MEVFEIAGARDSPVVVSVPHCGRRVPEEIAAQLAAPVERAIGEGDTYADVLARTGLGQATVIEARIARLAIDLNRSGTVAELDLEGDPDRERERLVRLYDREGRLLWRSAIGRPPLEREELERRIERYHEPYHAALRDCLERAGRPCALVDMHSMSDPTFDLVIGDFRGRSAGEELCERGVKRFFVERGYRVGYAGPRRTDSRGRAVSRAAIRYSGGFITSCYGDPRRGRYAVQIEVNRDVCGRRLEEMKADFGEFFAFLRRWLEECGGSVLCVG